MAKENFKKVADFVTWSELKINIHFFRDISKTYFREREVWWASLGINIGQEEDGKNERFERQVIILKKINRNLAIIAPLTGQIRDLPGRYLVSLKNGRSDILIYQIRLISSKRLIRKIARIASLNFSEIKTIVKASL